MQHDVDEIGPNAQKVKAGVRAIAGNLMIIDVALRMPSARKSVIIACNFYYFETDAGNVRSGSGN